MPGPLSPVSACILKELEIIGGHTSRVYDSAQLANTLTLTLQGQQSTAGEKPSLCLLVNSGSRCILSIRLSDLLPTKPPFLQAISTKAIAQQLRINVQEQEHAVIATFEHKREFNLAVYMLQEYGFSIKEPTMETTELGHGGSQSSTLTFENPTDFGPRLSSITNFPGIESGTGLASQIGVSWDSHSGSYISDLHPEVLSSSHHSKRSHLLQSRQNSLPSSFSSTSQLPHTSYMTQFNPYNVFLGKQTYDNHRPKVSSPLRNTLSPSDPLQKVISQPLSQNHLRLPPSPTPKPASTTEGASPQCDLHSNDTKNIEPTPPISSQPPVLSPSLPPSPVSFYRHHSDSSAERSSPSVNQFRELMPPTRSLPFSPRNMIQSNPIDDNPPESEEQSPDLSSPRVQNKRKRKPKNPEPGKGKSSEPPKKKPATEANPPKTTALGSSLDQGDVKLASVTKTPKLSRQTLPSKQKKQQSPSLSPNLDTSIDIPQEKPKPNPTNTKAAKKPKQKTQSKTNPRSRTSIRDQPPNAVGDSPEVDVMSPMKEKPKFTSKPNTKENPKPTSTPQTKEPKKKRKGNGNTPLKKGSTSEAHNIPDAIDSQPQRKPIRLIVKSRSRNENSATDSAQKSNSKPADPEVNSESHIPKGCVTPETNMQEQGPPPNELQPASPSVCLFPKCDVAILVTDEMIRQVNEMTSDLFDQFESDLKKGRNDATLAQYYLDQIMEIRKTFWQSEMAKTSHDAYTTTF